VIEDGYDRRGWLQIFLCFMHSLLIFLYGFLSTRLFSSSGYQLLVDFIQPYIAPWTVDIMHQWNLQQHAWLIIFQTYQTNWPMSKIREKDRTFHGSEPSQSCTHLRLWMSSPSVVVLRSIMSVQRSKEFRSSMLSLSVTSKESNTAGANNRAEDIV
jgi:hypothetical protein